MKILAIDPGFEKVGYAFFEKISSSNFKYLDSGLVKTPKTDELQIRLLSIFDQLKKIIDKNKPELIVFEQIFFFKNAKTVIKVSQAQGILLLLAAQEKIPVKTLAPLQIKQIITGNGTADKKAVRKMLDLSLKEKINYKDDDQSDAVACGLAYCYLNEKLV